MSATILVSQGNLADSVDSQKVSSLPQTSLPPSVSEAPVSFTFVPPVSSSMASEPGPVSAPSTISGVGREDTAGAGNGATAPQDATGTQSGDDANNSNPPTTPIGVSPGAVAGISTGCAVFGLLLGFLAAWFLLKRRHSRERVSRRSSRGRRWSTKDDIEPKYFETSYDLGGSGIQLAHFLLDATSDAEMAAEVRSLGQLIQQHVESSYHSQKAQVSRRDLTQAAVNLGLDQGGSLSADVIVSLALDTRTRQIALQHVLSFVLFSSIDFGTRSRLSMLPAPIAALLQSMPPAERGKANGEAVAIGLSRWRALSAFLLHPTRSDRTALLPSNSATMPQAAGLASALDTFLGAFVFGDDESRQEQKNHLEEVIVEVARLGYILLSQPSDLRLVHVQGRKPADMMAVVCAGLDKVTMRDGTPLDGPRVVLAPTLVQV
ncbi:hypothetical protein B0T11DRAFT_145257 [Plectosphaerella cucumerina]|uniref:Uncharacterized protein n=1 Tax=Plectosphaerella cucumerina TaxID=40658 RepID=A0A8K0T803_9PEZI|nr:hypothetical protein B0T11DRAFT_145257 [Plectosphaerella cucumerina]